MSEVDWVRGIGYSIVASIIGGASKLTIRKSWLIERNLNTQGGENYPISQNAEGSNMSDSSGSLKSRSMTNRNSYNKACSQSDLGSNYELQDSPSSDLDDVQTTTSKSRTKLIARALRFSGMIGMTFLNPLFCVLAMNYASPSILAPFSGLTLVWIILFSEMLNGERPNVTQVLAVFLIVVGEVIVAIWGDHTNDDGTSLDDVVTSYKNRCFQIYFIFISLWLLALFYFIKRKSPTPPSVRRFAWGVSGGSVTGLQNFLKDSLTIIKALKVDGSDEDGNDGGNDESFYHWFLLMMIFFGIATSFGGLLCLSSCMKRYDATFSSAMFVGSFVISASLMSAVHYNTFQNLQGIWNWIMYPIGICILMLGVMILVRNTVETEDRNSDTIRTGVDDTPFISNTGEDEIEFKSSTII